MKEYLNSETSYKPRGNKSNYSQYNSSYGRGNPQQGGYKHNKNKPNYGKSGKYPEKQNYKSSYHNKFDNKQGEKKYDDFSKPTKFYASKLTRTHTHSGSLKENIQDNKFDNQSQDARKPFKPAETTIPENLEVRNTNNYYKKTDDTVLTEPRFSYKPERSNHGSNAGKGFIRNVNIPDSIPVFFKSEVKNPSEVKSPHESKAEPRASERNLEDGMKRLHLEEDVNTHYIAFLEEPPKTRGKGEDGEDEIKRNARIQTL